MTQLEQLIPLASSWAGQQEEAILKSGVELNDLQMADAQKVGVQNPQKVRLLKVAQIPMPDHPLLAAVANQTALISKDTAGLTVRYGIFIRQDCWLNRRLIAHELVHTMQYERLGGFEDFLKAYLAECLITHKYPEGPMEAEADLISTNLCGG